LWESNALLEQKNTLLENLIHAMRINPECVVQDILQRLRSESDPYSLSQFVQLQPTFGDTTWVTAPPTPDLVCSTSGKMIDEGTAGTVEFDDIAMFIEYPD
jgi:hypothetical protein